MKLFKAIMLLEYLHGLDLIECVTLLKSIKSEFLCFIIDILYNVFRGVLKVDLKKIKSIEPYKKLILVILKKRLSLKKRLQVLIKNKEFLCFVLKIAVNALRTLLLKNKNGEIKKVFPGGK